MNFSVGTNFDTEIIETISNYNQDRIFDSVFGKLKTDFLGGGRASSLLPEIDINTLHNYIQLCHQNNLKFNYLLNPGCLSNKEVIPEYHKKIVNFIGQIVDLGIDQVTVTSPFLCSIIKKQFPHIKITVGLYAWCSNITQMITWKEIGADEITLTNSLIRDFRSLEKMIRTAKNTGLKLRLIANNVCLRDCTYKYSHATEIAHSSQLNEPGAEYFIDYNLIRCTYKKFSDPSQFLSSEWIRPEDIIIYEELCNNIGYTDFSIKLLDRSKSTKFLNRVIKTYATRSYDGNLLDILVLPTDGKVEATVAQNIFYTRKYQFNPTELIKLADVFSFPKVYIDNKKLNGFLAKFVNGDSCSGKLCYGDCSFNKELSSDCSYCKEWADKVISFDNKEINSWKKSVNKFMENMHSGIVFNL